MVTRLVLGCGGVGQRIVEGLAATGIRPLVVSEDPAVVETLREDNVPAQTGDPTDPAVLSVADRPAVVLIAGDRTDRNRVALANARERYPDAAVIAYVGGNPTDADLREMAADADHLIDPRREMAARIVQESTSDAAEVAIRLREHLSAIDGRLAVVTHDNPDPDAIASAVALVDLAAAVGVDADACYFGEISHQENRAMVNLLDLDLTNLDADAPLGEYDAFALVDHSRPGVNDQLPAELHVDIVIDHHPARGPVGGTFLDLREGAGATSTVLTEYLDQFGLAFDRRTATALLYGIQVDTNDFTREVSPMDFRAAATLLPHVDQGVLDRIEEPTVDGETLDTIARSIKNRVQQGAVVAASAGRITNRDALPQAADHLLNMAGVHTTLVFGFIDEMVFLSARSRSDALDLGEILREAFDPIGSAGGHSDMAGAQLEIGVLGGVDDEMHVDSIVRVVEEVITDRFFEAVWTRPDSPVGAADRASERLFDPGEGPAGESDVPAGDREENGGHRDPRDGFDDGSDDGSDGGSDPDMDE